MMKKDSSLHMIVTLLVISIVVAGLMAFINDLTAPIIADNNEKALNNSLAELIDADNYEKMGFNDCVAYVAEANGEKLGVIIQNYEKGYGGTVEILTGVNNDGEIVGVKILNHSETPGLGANATNESFRNQYKGKSGNIKVSKTTSSDTEIKAISGATVTSKAVTNAVNKAVLVAEKVLRG